MTRKNALVLIGDKGTGKTSFLNALKSNYEQHSDNPDGFETDSCRFISISDLTLAGIERKHKVDVLFCFALDDSQSFSNVQKKWKSDVGDYLSDHSINYNLYLLGLKSDLKSGAQSLQDIGKCAAEIGALEYFECSFLEPKSCMQVWNAIQEYVTLKSPISHLDADSIPNEEAGSPTTEAKAESARPKSSERKIQIGAEESKPPSSDLESPSAVSEDIVTASDVVAAPSLIEKTPRSKEIDCDVTNPVIPPKELPDTSLFLPSIPNSSLLPSISQNSLSLEEEFANFDFDKPLTPLPSVVPEQVVVESRDVPSPINRPSATGTQKRSSVWGLLFSKKSNRKSQYRSSSSDQTLAFSPSIPLSQPEHSAASRTNPATKKKGFFARFFGS